MQQPNAPVPNPPATDWKSQLKTEIGKTVSDYRERVQAAAVDVELLKKEALWTFRLVKFTTAFIVGFGLALLVLSIVLFLLGRPPIEVLGIGGLSAADFVTVFAYKPLDRLRTAATDFGQQVVILSTWSLAVHLILLTVDENDPDSLHKAEKRLCEIALEFSKALQEYVG